MTNPVVNVRRALAQALTNDAHANVSRADASNIVKAALTSITSAKKPIDTYTFIAIRDEVEKAKEFLATKPTGYADVKAFEILEQFPKKGQAAVSAHALQLAQIKPSGDAARDAKQLAEQGLQAMARARNPEATFDRYFELLQAMQWSFDRTRDFTPISSDFYDRAQAILKTRG